VHFFFSGFSPHLVVNKFRVPVIPAQSVGMANGRHGGKTCFERRQLLLMAPVETALKTFDRRHGRRSKQT